MLLQRLEEYANRLDLPPMLYTKIPVRYIVELETDDQGHLLHVELNDTSDPSNPSTKRGEPRDVPYVQPSSNIKPQLLASNAEYTFGLPAGVTKPERAARCHRAYLELLARCVQHTQEPTVRAVSLFLNNAPLAHLQLPADMDRGARITFRVNGVFPVDLPVIQSFWATENDPALKSAPIMQCLVCGQERPVLARLQAKLKGVPGGQAPGTALISANADAFESYGLSASLTAPTCAACGERFTKAANDLLANDVNHIVLRGAVFIFWTRTKVDFSPRTYISNPRPEQVNQLLHTVLTGKRSPKVDETRFYATVLSGSGSRAVVRDWIDTTVGEVKQHLAIWFQRQRIVGPQGEEPQPLGLYALAAVTVRELRDVSTPTTRALLRSALTDSPLPLRLLDQVIRRIRAERRVTRPHAALIKLVLLSQSASQPDTKEDTLVRLDPHHPSRAYHCGRLLAVLEDIQTSAIRNINTTVVDRFYGAASSAPFSVFPRLLVGARAHLAKLRRDNLGAFHALEQRLGDIHDQLTEYPHILDLKEQCLFHIGFYHQQSWGRDQRRKASEQRKAGLALEADVPSIGAVESTADITKENE